MFKYKSLSLTKYAKDMFKMVNEVTIEFLKKEKVMNPFIKKLVDEIILFNKLKIVDIFSSEKSFEQTFDYNISILKEIDKLNDLKKVSPIEKFTFIFKKI